MSFVCGISPAWGHCGGAAGTTWSLADSDTDRALVQFFLPYIRFRRRKMESIPVCVHRPQAQAAAASNLSLVFLRSSVMEEDGDLDSSDDKFGNLPDHLLIEIFIKVPISEWCQISCVKKQWAALFRGECLWETAISRTWPLPAQRKKWPGPIPRGSSRRRYEALYVSKRVFRLEWEVDELMGHIYLFLKHQLEHSTMPPSIGILRGTIIDQFIACGESSDRAYELSALVWLAVINNLEENERTYLLLKHIALEGDVFLPYPYSRSYKVDWRIFEKLFTDFRDCFSQADFFDVLACAKYKFQGIPSTWLGY
ncbi:hypothetical protein H6P81_009220 [Aristolochia fimbriata]|uniref:F-box domain-containing protein n=1 Tax=Aristolochia fimbriata TaxID=158543 RepID=A0AAV7EK82_ARIFI|nr:hypothetical protein H6P81_009220 [Aristolochia fimbriata]